MNVLLLFHSIVRPENLGFCDRWRYFYLELPCLDYWPATERRVGNILLHLVRSYMNLWYLLHWFHYLFTGSVSLIQVWTGVVDAYVWTTKDPQLGTCILCTYRRHAIFKRHLYTYIVHCTSMAVVSLFSWLFLSLKGVYTHTLGRLRTHSQGVVSMVHTHFVVGIKYGCHFSVSNE